MGGRRIVILPRAVARAPIGTHLIAMALATPMLFFPKVASADLLFTFTQTASTPAGALLASGSLLLGDAAFQSGINLDLASNFAPGRNDLAGSGIDLLDFSVTAPGGVSLAAATKDFIPSAPVAKFLWSVQLFSSPFGTPTGQIRFNDLADDFAFFLGSPVSTGSFNTDNPAGFPCSRTGACGFAGTWTSAGVVAVSEPASLGLLGLGLAGLGFIWRKLRTSGRS
jgi:hypothetical protein